MANNVAITPQHQQTNLQRMKAIVSGENYLAKVKNLLGNQSQAFTASLLDLYTTDGYLAKCNPAEVITEALKAAALNMPIQKGMGLAYVIPYAGKPQFQLSYKGIVQLCLRSGQYKIINVSAVYEGQDVKRDLITGMFDITGEKTSENAIGYFAYFELLNGFKKGEYWSKSEIEAHAKKYSKAWSKADSPWHTQFDAMAKKTVLKNLLSKFGVMSIEFASAFDSDRGDDSDVESEVAENANGKAVVMPESIEVEPVAVEDSKPNEEVPSKNAEPVQTTIDEDPGF